MRTIGILALVCLFPLPTLAQEDDRIRLGTWNIENLGSRRNPRTNDDYEATAKFIKSLEIDVLGVQEINGPRPLHKLCRYLGKDWSFVIGTSGKFTRGSKMIAVGFLWNTKRVTLVQAQELKQLPRNTESGMWVFHRQPVSAVFRSNKGGIDFRAVVVHFKAGRMNRGSRGEKDSAKRKVETEMLGKLLSDMIAKDGEDQDLVVLGDFNHDRSYPAFKVFSKYFDYQKPVAKHRTIIHFDEQIDHIAVSKGLKEEIIPSSCKIQSEKYEADPRSWRRFSDHIPLTIDLDASRDRDPQAKFSPVPTEQALKAKLGGRTEWF